MKLLSDYAKLITDPMFDVCCDTKLTPGQTLTVLESAKAVIEIEIARWRETVERQTMSEPVEKPPPANEPREQTLLANLNYLLHHCETAVRRFELLHQGGVKMTLGADPNTGASELRQAIKTVLKSQAAAPQPEPPSETGQPAVTQLAFGLAVESQDAPPAASPAASETPSPASKSIRFTAWCDRNGNCSHHTEDGKDHSGEYVRASELAALRAENEELKRVLRRCAVAAVECTGEESKDLPALSEALSVAPETADDFVNSKVAERECRLAQCEESLTTARETIARLERERDGAIEKTERLEVMECSVDCSAKDRELYRAIGFLKDTIVLQCQGCGNHQIIEQHRYKSGEFDYRIISSKAIEWLKGQLTSSAYRAATAEAQVTALTKERDALQITSGASPGKE